jgi:hypothetical protein
MRELTARLTALERQRLAMGRQSAAGDGGGLGYSGAPTPQPARSPGASSSASRALGRTSRSFRTQARAGSPTSGAARSDVGLGTSASVPALPAAATRAGGHADEDDIDSGGAGAPDGLLTHARQRVLVESLYPPCVVSPLAVTDPYFGSEQGDYVAETYCELLVLSKTLIDHRAFSKAQLADIAAKSTSFPRDEMVLAKAEAEKEWAATRAAVLAGVDKKRWPGLKGDAAAAGPVAVAGAATGGRSDSRMSAAAGGAAGRSNSRL